MFDLSAASGYRPEDIQAAIDRARQSSTPSPAPAAAPTMSNQDLIKQQLAGLSNNPVGLDQWLANQAGNYSLEDLSAASGYNVADIQAAMAGARQRLGM